jgi:hypothetical protein
MTTTIPDIGKAHGGRYEVFAYIPHIDHSVPHDVPYENMLYYWGKKKELLGVMQPAEP